MILTQKKVVANCSRQQPYASAVTPPKAEGRNRQTAWKKRRAGPYNPNQGQAAVLINYSQEQAAVLINHSQERAADLVNYS